MGSIPNPIALRKARIVYNFGLSECNWLNDTNLAFLSAIGLYDAILAFLSAIGLNQSTPVRLKSFQEQILFILNLTQLNI